MDTYRISWKRSATPTVLLFGLMAAISAKAAPVSVSGAFGQYTGAVGNGSVFGDQYRTLVNGKTVAPTEPIPGLEAYYTPGDTTLPEDDPLYVGQGLGRTTVDLEGASSVTFSTSYYDPSLDVWVDETENVLGFTPGPEADVGVGEEFLLGTFTLANGIFWAADPIHRFSFTLATTSSDPALDGKNFVDTIELQITGNCFLQPYCGDLGYKPENNADLFYLSTRRDIGTMAVYEFQDSPTGSNSGTIDLYGKIGSLIPTRFANPQGGVILGPPGGFPPPEPPTPVPAPPILLLLAAGALGMAWARRRDRTRSTGSVSTPVI